MPQTEKSPEKLRVVGGTDVPLEVVATKVQPYPSGTAGQQDSAPTLCADRKGV